MKKLVLLMLLMSCMMIQAEPLSLKCQALKATVDNILSKKARVEDIKDDTLRAAAHYLIRAENNMTYALVLALYEEIMTSKKSRPGSTRHKLVFFPDKTGLESVKYFRIVQDLFIECGANLKEAQQFIDKIESFYSYDLDLALSNYLMNAHNVLVLGGPFPMVESMKLFVALGANIYQTKYAEKNLLESLMLSNKYELGKIDLEIVEFLLKNKVDPNRIIEADGKRILDVVEEAPGNNEKLIELLKKYGARDRSSESYWTRFKSLWKKG